MIIELILSIIIGVFIYIFLFILQFLIKLFFKITLDLWGHFQDAKNLLHRIINISFFLLFEAIIGIIIFAIFWEVISLSNRYIISNDDIKLHHLVSVFIGILLGTISSKEFIEKKIINHM